MVSSNPDRLTMVVAMCLLSYAAHHLGGASTREKATSLRLNQDELLHVLAAFKAAATPPSAPNTTDTVWARRTYAPMLIHSPALSQYREQIRAAFPEHEITFDVTFAAASTAVPWHTDFDSLGPFDSSIASIARGDFVTVHTNIVSPGGRNDGCLRTIDSLLVSALHFVANRVLNNFGALASLTEPLATLLGAHIREHDSTPGVGNVFNNLKAHDVTQGDGRISYVVRLVRKGVPLSREKVLAAARGKSGSTRRIREFERFLPLLEGRAAVPAGEFPWAQVA